MILNKYATNILLMFTALIDSLISCNNISLAD